MHMNLDNTILTLCGLSLFLKGRVLCALVNRSSCYRSWAFKGWSWGWLLGMVPTMLPGQVVQPTPAREHLAAAYVEQTSWMLGWQGHIKLGRWNPLQLDITLKQPVRARLKIVTLDPEGDVAEYTYPWQELGPGTHRVRGVFQCGRWQAPLTTIFETAEYALAVREWTADERNELRASCRLFALLGCPEVWQEWLAYRQGRERGLALVYSRADDLLFDARALPCVDTIILGGTIWETSLSASQSELLRGWLADGGQLVLLLPRDPRRFLAQPFAEWLPLEISPEPLAVRELGDLERFAGLNLRVPLIGRETMTRMHSIEGEVLAVTRDNPLVLRVPYGFGEVRCLALDPTTAPLSRWGGLKNLIQNMSDVPVNTRHQTADPPPDARPRQEALAATGITDLASQLVACLQDFRGVGRPSPLETMAWMLVLIVVVGPVDYVFVHYVLRRPQATWVTLPVLLILATWLGVQRAESQNLHTALAQQWDILDYDLGQHRMRVQSWWSCYSPETQRFQINLQSGWNPNSITENQQAARGPTPEPTDSPLNASLPKETTCLGWFVAPENTVGGLYRTESMEWGSTPYTLFPAEASLQEMPWLKWSVRICQARWSTWMAAPMTVDVRSTGVGRLAGRLQHHLPGTLTDWILAFGSRVYRRQPNRGDETSLPWPANTWLELNDPQVFQRDLKGMLNGVIVWQDQAEGKVRPEVRARQTRYDPLERDWIRLMQILTFHRAAGDTEYTTLTNQLIAELDLSRQLEMGRAVLLGRLAAAPPAVYATIPKPAIQRQEVFVRLVFPVPRSVDVLRELPRFERP
ncbi:MAG: hypothetical protein KatS3mg114_0415 [Planctomycetaceae bacterium]|nr:MAG: hypothetical protein KatS3mg114_0415 [Planctomycetaceae bacterium]